MPVLHCYRRCHRTWHHGRPVARAARLFQLPWPHMTDRVPEPPPFRSGLHERLFSDFAKFSPRSAPGRMGIESMLRSCAIIRGPPGLFGFCHVPPSLHDAQSLVSFSCSPSTCCSVSAFDECFPFFVALAGEGRNQVWHEHPGICSPPRQVQRIDR